MGPLGLLPGAWGRGSGVHAGTLGIRIISSTSPLSSQWHQQKELFSEQSHSEVAGWGVMVAAPHTYLQRGETRISWLCGCQQSLPLSVPPQKEAEEQEHPLGTRGQHRCYHMEGCLPRSGLSDPRIPSLPFSLSRRIEEKAPCWLRTEGPPGASGCRGHRSPWSCLHNYLVTPLLPPCMALSCWGSSSSPGHTCLNSPAGSREASGIWCEGQSPLVFTGEWSGRRFAGGEWNNQRQEGKVGKLNAWVTEKWEIASNAWQTGWESAWKLR